MEKLINAITEEVMKRLKELIHNEEEKCEKKLPKLLCIDLENKDIYDELAEKFEIHSLEYKEDLDAYDGIVLGKLGNRELTNLALGSHCGVREQVIIDSILRGKNIYILEEEIQYRKFQSTCNKVFYRLYQQYEAKILSYGIKLVKKDDILERLCDKKIVKIHNEDSIIQTEKILEKSLNNTIQVQNKDENINYVEENTFYKESDNIKSITLDKRLIIETDLKKMRKKGIKEVIISSNSIITPLAKDYIRVNKLKVTRA